MRERRTQVLLIEVPFYAPFGWFCITKYMMFAIFMSKETKTTLKKQETR